MKPNMPRSSGSPRADPESLLQKHGVPATLARDLVRWGEALRAESARLHVEAAASFDLENGAPAGPMRTGRASHVDIGAQIAAMQPERRYIALHTHQTSASFSDQDVALLLDNAFLWTIAVIGADGSWYLLSRQSGVSSASAALAVRTFQQAMGPLTPIYAREGQQQGVGRAVVLRQLTHDLWELIAPSLGLRCDRGRQRR
jgi:hypothetical protein